MTQKEDWYSAEYESDTVLLLGEVSAGQRPPYVIAHFGQDAYEMYQIAAYVKELTRVRTTDYLCWAPGFRLFGEVAAELLKRKGRLTVEDFGSTLFSTVDKIDKILAQAGVKEPQRVHYYGIEVSPTFCEMAECLHPDRVIKHVADWRTLPLPNGPLISRSYQATSYGFTSTRDLAEWIGRAAFSLQGLWVADGAEERTTQILGKRLHLFDYAALRTSLQAMGRRLAVLSNQRYQIRDETFLAVWFIVYDPKQIDVGQLTPAFARDFGRDLSQSDISDLPPGGEALPHAGGLGMEISPELISDPTFNFGSNNIHAAYLAYQKTSRQVAQDRAKK